MCNSKTVHQSKTVYQKERTPRSLWFDPRFAIGIGLVVVSVLGVLGIVSTADRTVEVYAAGTALSPGDRVQASDLALRSVRLGEARGRYLLRGDMPVDGLVVSRAIAAGELVPSAAVGDTAGLRFASVVVDVHGQLPQSVVTGASVDLWSAKEVEQGVFGPPSVLVSAAIVVRVVKPEGLVAGGMVSVEVLVARAKTAQVLEAVANRDAISLVPVNLPTKG